jgi:hypothetical protein
MPVITSLDTKHPDRWNHETRAPGIKQFANALQLWAYAQGRFVTVSEASDVFNVDRSLIRQAVEHHAWMELGADDAIIHEV